MNALWLPYEVTDLPAVLDFYERRLGLHRTDEWDRDGERGVVLKAADAAYLEFVTGTPRAVPLAFELATPSDVDSWHARLAGSLSDRPHRFPRGHYGFTLRAPNGADVQLWSES